MANDITVLKRGESLPFVFDRGGESIDGWVCTIEVKKFPSDNSSITRVITPVGDTWPGFLTTSETQGLAAGTFRLIGVLVNSSTNEEEQITETTRFNITDSWASRTNSILFEDDALLLLEGQ